MGSLHVSMAPGIFCQLISRLFAGWKLLFLPCSSVKENGMKLAKGQVNHAEGEHLSFEISLTF